MTKATLYESAHGVLRPGLYVAPSRTSGYDRLMALVVVGHAQLVGARFLIDGRKAITVLIPGSPTRSNPPEGGQKITIGREFFVTALKDYHDWKQKWWRECIQNSVDGGATEIQMFATENPDNTWTVRCVDNGRGMSEEVLLNKFLVLGGTTKAGQAGAAGGFGKAKELLILPWISWKIHTRDIVAAGSGIEYAVAKAPPINGTMIEVVMPADNYTYGSPAEAFVSKCFLPGIKFYVNGARHEANLKIDDRLADLGLAHVGVAKTRYAGNHLYVRVNGIFMFEDYIGPTEGNQVICEITAPSVQVLTANRDGFRDPTLKRAISDLMVRFAKDTKSALRAKRGLFERIYEGDPSQRFTAKVEEAKIIEQIGPVGVGGTIEARAVQQVAEIVETYREQMEASGQASGPTGIPSGEIVQEILNTVAGNGQSTLEAAARQFVWKPDFIVRNEVPGLATARSAGKLKKFMPESMTPTITRLARVWGELCRYVLIQLDCQRPYGVGFLFEERASAAYRPDSSRFGSGSGWLLLNPAKNYKDFSDGETIEVYTPTKHADLKYLYALAVHECTHMADGIDYHDEDFTSAMTHNMARCADGFRFAKKIVAGIKLKDVEGVRQKRGAKKADGSIPSDLSRSFMKSKAAFRNDGYPESEAYLEAKSSLITQLIVSRNLERDVALRMVDRWEDTGEIS